MQNTSSLQLHAPAYTIILEIQKRHPEIAAFNFVKYRAITPLEDRLRRNAPRKLLAVMDQASQLRSTWSTVGGLPYWESILATQSGIPEFEFLLREAVRDTSIDEFIQLPTSQVTATSIQSLNAILEFDQCLGFVSTCHLTDGSTAHIPLLDYRIRPEPTSIHRITQILRLLDQPNSVIAYSGNSFHSWGLNLLSPSAFQHFLASGLLLSPLIDIRYCARGLLNGKSTLRISTNFRKPELPDVVAIL